MASKRKLKSLIKKHTKLKEQIQQLQSEIEQECKTIITNSKKVVVIEREYPIKEGRKIVGKRIDKITCLQWDEEFKDESTGESITIKRHLPVKRNDEWELSNTSLSQIIRLA